MTKSKLQILQTNYNNYCVNKNFKKNVLFTTVIFKCEFYNYIYTVFKLLFQIYFILLLVPWFIDGIVINGFLQPRLLSTPSYPHISYHNKSLVSMVWSIPSFSFFFPGINISVFAAAVNILLFFLFVQTRQAFSVLFTPLHLYMPSPYL